MQKPKRGPARMVEFCFHSNRGSCWDPETASPYSPSLDLERPTLLPMAPFYPRFLLLLLSVSLCLCCETSNKSTVSRVSVSDLSLLRILTKTLFVLGTGDSFYDVHLFILWISSRCQLLKKSSGGRRRNCSPAFFFSKTCCSSPFPRPHQQTCLFTSQSCPSYPWPTDSSLSLLFLSSGTSLTSYLEIYSTLAKVSFQGEAINANTIQTIAVTVASCHFCWVPHSGLPDQWLQGQNSSWCHEEKVQIYLSSSRWSTVDLASCHGKSNRCYSSSLWRWFVSKG